MRSARHLHLRGVRIASPRDFWAGLLFGGFGLFMAIYAATHYAIGTAVRLRKL